MSDRQLVKRIRQRDPFSHPDEELLKIMSEDWQRSDDHYKQILNDAEEDWKRYLIIKDTSDEPTVGEQSSFDPQEGARANLKLATVRKHLATAISLTMNSLHPNDAEWLHAYAVSDFTGADYDELAQKIEKYRRFRLYELSSEQMAYWDRIQAFLLQGFIFPWSLCLLNWTTEGRWERTNDAASAEPGKYDVNLGYKFNPEYINRPNLPVLHTANTRPDPRGGMLLRDCAFLMDELRIPWYELYENEFSPQNEKGIYFNLEKLQEATGLDDSNMTPEEEMRLRIGEVDRQGVTASEEHKEKEAFRNTIRIRRYWTKFGVITANADLDVIISKRRYERVPLYDFKATMDWSKFESQSFARILRGFDDVKDMLFNYRLNNLSFGIDGILVFDGTRIHKSSRNKPMHPGREIEFNGPIDHALDIIRTNDITQGTFADSAQIDRETESTMGQSENALGQYFGGGRRLATEVQSVAAATSQRGSQMVQRMQDLIITPQQNEITRMEVDRLRGERIVRIKEKGRFRYLTITHEFIEEMASQIYFEAKGSAYVNHEQIKAAGAMNAANVLMNNPMLAQVMNPIAVAQWIARDVGREPKPDRFLKPGLQNQPHNPPEIEYLLMRQGVELEPHPLDDDQQHLKEHYIQLERVQTMKGQGMSAEGVMRLEKHIALTEKKIEGMQQMAAQQAGPVGNVLPGQEGSQETAGTQGANLENPQPQGVGPPQSMGVIG